MGVHVTLSYKVRTWMSWMPAGLTMLTASPCRRTRELGTGCWASNLLEREYKESTLPGQQGTPNTNVTRTYQPLHNLHLRQRYYWAWTATWKLPSTAIPYHTTPYHALIYARKIATTDAVPRSVETDGCILLLLLLGWMFRYFDHWICCILMHNMFGLFSHRDFN